MNPRIKAIHSAMLAVAVPCNGVPKKTTPMVDLNRYAYFVWSREALSNAYGRAIVCKKEYRNMILNSDPEVSPEQQQRLQSMTQ